MLKIEGEIVEIGTLENADQKADIGLVLKTNEGEFITVSGLSVGEIWKLGKAVYQQASITIEVPNAKVSGVPPQD